ncbi:MAG: ribosome maturation factor RimM [Bacteroidota bacterium]|nr:ribosome maturation factor RimM [Bacteroidota bacterium]
MAQELCLIGTIVAAHGIRGAVRVQSHSDIPGRFSRLGQVLVGSAPENVDMLSVVSVSEDGSKVLLHFSSSNDRDTAEDLVGRHLYITDEQMEAPPEGRYFVHDLIGCHVETTEGASRGIVRDVMLLPANDVYVVEYRGFEVLIPAVPDFIQSVDTAGKRIVVTPVDGLFEDFDED